MIFKNKYIYFVLATLIIIFTITFNYKNIYSVDSPEEQEYKQYVVQFINDLNKLRNQYPVVFKPDIKYLSDNTIAIQKRSEYLKTFNFPDDKVPEKYRDVHKKLKETLEIYNEAFSDILLATASGDTKSVSKNLEKLRNADKAMIEIENIFLR